MPGRTRTMKATKVLLGMIACIGGMLLLTTPVGAKKVEVDGFLENATHVRDGRGLSKFRNTAQLEFMKEIDSNFFSQFSINGVLRATYDGVYDLNDDEFGASAREDYLGQNWHPRGDATTGHPILGGKPFLSAPVPFPCENDPTLCRNLDDYMDLDEDEAKFPEFNDEFDFIRELYLDTAYDLSGGDKFAVRLGKQQVVWGKTDLFRVLDVINPVDYSRHNIYDELEDIRIPQWILQAESRMGQTGIFSEFNSTLVWNFDKFRPSVLGQSGQPYAILDAGNFFSSYLNIDAHPVVGPLYPGGPVPIIHDVDIPSWKLRNTQIGLKFEGVYKDTTFSANILHYRQQLPSLHFREHPAVPGSGLPATDGVFDIVFPRVNLFGGSIDYYSQSMDAVWRLEAVYTNGEELPRDKDGHKETDIVRYVIGFDKNQMIPFLNKKRAFLISTQVFGQHILDHENDMPDYKDNWTATLLLKGWWYSDRISPQLLMARDIRSDGMAVAPSIEWLMTDNLKITLTANVKSGGKKKFDWSANDALAGESLPNDYEPLARFTNGPMGVANQEDEIQLTLRYTF
ncbi:DUF1302 family protein [Desulfuromonas sp. TF]|uniref:DUF1302 family protein n=1 Tax=Desulfuromonas sp. TF TaxID=1232410 RepID=UPI000408464C|nr:DUF1302 family protein [Desulfuromonas sp. TF]